jgi:hypothetical protein
MPKYMFISKICEKFQIKRLDEKKVYLQKILNLSVKHQVAHEQYPEFLYYRPY